MTQDKARVHLRTWFDTIAPPGIPLLKTEVDGITASPTHNNRLQRSEELTARLNEVRRAVKAVFSTDRPQLQEGICYFIYRREQGALDPLYVGTSHCIGKSGGLNSLFNPGQWLRFGDGHNSNGHIDCFSRAIEGQNGGYQHWVDALVEPQGARAAPVLLRSPVYVHVELWDQTSQSVLPEFGHTPLLVEEFLRIWLLRTAGYGGQLLNRDGNRRLG